MTERERLIDLLIEGGKIAGDQVHKEILDIVKKTHHFSNKNNADEVTSIHTLLADYLIANGVILPPVKVGDTVYIISRHNGIRRRKVVEILMAEECSFVVGGDIYSEERYHFSYIGKTVFLSREEATAALNKTDLSAGFFRKMG